MKKVNMICCSTDNWDDIWRRRQHLCNGFSKKEWIGKILFVEPACSVFSVLKRFDFKQFKDTGNIRKVNEKIYVFKPIWPIPFVRFAIARKLNFNIYLKQVKRCIKRLKLENIITWFSHPNYESITGKFGEKVIWYDCTDDWSIMPGVNKASKKMLKRQHVDMIKRANFVTAVSEYLVNEAKRYNKNSYLIQNGVDFDFYNKALNENDSMPEDLKSIPKPILGYIGSIWEDRLDIELVKYIAEKRKDWSIVFIGPVTVKSGLDYLLKFKNVHFLGQRPYKDLRHYLLNFDVCMIPHKINRLTESMNPIKLYEYFAAGRPVVSTNLAGVRGFKNVVEIAKDCEDFLRLTEKLISNDNQEYSAKQKDIARNNSWQKRVNDIEGLLNAIIYNNS